MGDLALLLSSLALLLLAAPSPSDSPNSTLDVEPAEARLLGSDSSAQILVTDRRPDGHPVDLTASARFESANPSVAEVGPDGLIRPKGNGETEVTARAGDRARTVRVVVEDIANTRPIRFASEVVPVFTKLGCNSGSCHGKSTGQNGFRLSLLGFDPRFDYDALVFEARGRRVFPAAPESSLLLLKTTAKVPHGGGRKIAIDSPEYSTLRRWIAQGMPFASGKESKLARISVSPERRVLDRKAAQQLRVTAHYDDGSAADVTRLAQFSSNAPDLATVDEKGRLTALDSVGEAAVMVRFGGRVTVARATIPLGRPVPAWEAPASTNLIDRYVFAKLRELGIPPSEACTDAEFARRSSLEICGILPRLEDVAAFEKDSNPDKRAAWVDRLIARPEYADLFAMKWSAILRNKRMNLFGQQQGGDPATFAMHNWIRQSLAEDKPYDRFVAEILAARGDAGTNPPVVLYRPANRQNKEELVDDTAQLFLGLRIQCARCHHHPFEKWSQDDYYGFAAFFERIGLKAGNDPATPRVYVLPTGLARNPTDGKSYKPKALDGPELSDLGRNDDPRQALAAWMRKADNPFFAKALVNRYWKHFFGVGLVEPEDDLRVSNPASNPELLDALADDFVKSGYDLRHLVRLIATSKAYDRSSLPNEFNASDRQNFARYYPRRLPAEVLLDALNEVAGTAEKFAGLPKGFRAAQLPDDGFNSYFLDVFGRPKRESVCECERVAEPNLSQRLHLLNSGEMESKIGDGSGRAAKWAADEKRPDAEKFDELYRLCFSRPPIADESEVCLAHLAKRRAEGKAKQGFEDLVWTLLNSKDFMFNR
jgi:hypothetical protein